MVSFTKPFHSEERALFSWTYRTEFSVIFCAGFEICGQRSNYKHMWGHVDVFEAHLLCLMQI